MEVQLISGTPLVPISEELLQGRISGAPPQGRGTILELPGLLAPPYYTIHPSTYLVRLSLMMVGREYPRETYNITRVALSFTRPVPSGVPTTRGGPRRREAPWSSTGTPTFCQVIIQIKTTTFEALESVERLKYCDHTRIALNQHVDSLIKNLNEPQTSAVCIHTYGYVPSPDVKSYPRLKIILEGEGLLIVNTNLNPSPLLNLLKWDGGIYSS